ncbi:MAG: thiamine diphosphokinase [Atribacterota bacterium]|jgi:thiamine pyrophosphokinase|nr:thiamine diphosphokinase [Atribacterota bacterium]MDD3031810.1 thiamine diphosphokinase [Atribacterota bacterium]
MQKHLEQVVIVGNGEDWKKEKVIRFCQKADFIIAADNGLTLLHNLNIQPNLIIGDFDSVSHELLEYYHHVPSKKHPIKKNFTDSELCIQEAISMNAKEIILLAMTGEYFDHSYASIMNFFRNYHKNINMKIITSNSTIFPVTEKTILSGFKDRRFSLFPLTNVTQFTMTGSQYNFLKDNLSFTDYSISNTIIKDKLEISFKKGKLFCVLFDKGFK